MSDAKGQGSGISVAKRKVLFDAILVGGMHECGAAQRASPFRAFRLAEVATAGLLAQNLAARRDLESLRHGLFGLDAFGTSHKLMFYRKKSAQYSGPAKPCKSYFLKFQMWLD
jgi:hypothetical protein